MQLFCSGIFCVHVKTTRSGGVCMKNDGKLFRATGSELFITNDGNSFSCKHTHICIILHKWFVRTDANESRRDKIQHFVCISNGSTTHSCSKYNTKQNDSKPNQSKREIVCLLFFFVLFYLDFIAQTLTCLLWLCIALLCMVLALRSVSNHCI